jgi:nucleotide-binding universal stress UspA family protein
MSWKSILVHVRAYQDAQPAVDAAISVAADFGARLTGLYTVRELAMLKLVMGQSHSAVREAEARDLPLAQQAEARFREACEKAGVSATFETAEGNASELLCMAGRSHDLMVIEQSAAGLDSLGTDSAEECVVAAGTSTLMVPKTRSSAHIGKTVVVAWNNSRQSAAALHGALPLIERAERVVVLLGEDRDSFPSVTKRPKVDIEAYLKLHAKNVRIAPYVQGGDGASLQAAAIAAGGDVLIMGAYGRSTWREFLFGGTTRDIMRDMKLPVLMGH